MSKTNMCKKIPISNLMEKMTINLTENQQLLKTLKLKPNKQLILIDYFTRSNRQKMAFSNFEFQRNSDCMVIACIVYCKQMTEICLQCRC